MITEVRLLDHLEAETELVRTLGMITLQLRRRDATVLAAVAFRVPVVLLTLAWQCAHWCFLATRDCIGEQPIAMLQAESVAHFPR